MKQKRSCLWLWNPGVIPPYPSEEFSRNRTLERLKTGIDSEHLDGAFTPLTDAELMAAWLEVRDTFLPQYIATNPGFRPWAWWEFDAPEPRRQVSGRRRKNYRNVPNCNLESQREYLTRHGLLTEAESLTNSHNHIY